MIKRAVDFFLWARPWRERFGTVPGLRVALALRRAIWSAPANSAVTVKLPRIPHAVRLRAGTSDAAVFEQVFGQRQADFPIFGDPKVIVDAGANIGLTAIIFAIRFPSAKVLALEIDRTNFSLLEENTRPYPNIQPVYMGLWSKKARLRITNPTADSWAFQTFEVPRDDRPAIEALGVSDILSDFDCREIDVLKIDIEGGECEVFQDGVDDWIARVGMLAVEVHDRIRPGCAAIVRRALETRGFEESKWAEYLLFHRKHS